MINSLFFISIKVNFVTRTSVFQARKLRVFLGLLSLKFHMVIMKGVARNLRVIIKVWAWAGKSMALDIAWKSPNSHYKKSCLSENTLPAGYGDPHLKPSPWKAEVGGLLRVSGYLVYIWSSRPAELHSETWPQQNQPTNKRTCYIIRRLQYNII